MISSSILWKYLYKLLKTRNAINLEANNDIQSSRSSIRSARINKIRTALLLCWVVAQVVAFDCHWLDTCESHIVYPLEVYPSLDTEDLFSIFQFTPSWPSSIQPWRPYGKLAHLLILNKNPSLNALKISKFNLLKSNDIYTFWPKFVGEIKAL